MKCNKCGLNNNEGNTNCSNCGNLLIDNKELNNNNENQSISNTNQARLVVIILGILLILFATVIGYYIFKTTNDNDILTDEKQDVNNDVQNKDEHQNNQQGIDNNIENKDEQENNKQDIDNNTQNKDEQSNDSIEQNADFDSDINHELVTSLMKIPNNTKDYFAGEKFFGYFYRQDSYKKSEISNQVKLYLAIRNLYEESWFETYYPKMIELTELEVKESFKDIFGENEQFVNESLEGSGCGFAAFQYDSNEKIYKQDGPSCGGTALPSYQTKIISAKKYDDRIEILEKVAYLEMDGDYMVYTSKNGQMLGVSKNTSHVQQQTNDIDYYYDQLNTYKYTFTYDKDNDKYYFDSVEKVNN